MIFIGDRNDNLTEGPYKGFITKCIKECLNGISTIKLNNNDEISNINCIINKTYAIDYFKNISDITGYDNKKIKNNNIIYNAKLNYYEDDIIVDNINQVQISNENKFISLLDLSKKNVDFYKFNLNMKSKDESITQKYN